MKPSGRVPLAPMPADTESCRWCRGPAPAGKCRINCLPADAPAWQLSRLTCPECGKQHDTGRTSHTEPCWQCDIAEEALTTAQWKAGGNKLTPYTRDRVQVNMASRRAS